MLAFAVMKQTNGGTVAPIDDRRLPERFWNKVSPEPNSGCWLWMGSLSRGYGKFFSTGAMRRAHRVSYEHLIGPILSLSEAGELMVLDHTCTTTQCVNPQHMESVTQKVNTRRGRLPDVTSKRHATRTHCVNGHDLSGENSTMYRGSRRCRTCARRRGRHFGLGPGQTETPT